MDILHLCRLCLTTSGYHFNIFTEIISDKHLYQFINNICELGVFRNDGYPEYICENCFKSIGNIIYFKTQAKETEAALTRMKRFRNMEEEKEVDEIEEAFDHSTVNQNSVKNEMETDGMINAGQEIGSGLITELAIKSEDIDEIAIPAEQVQIEKITELEESASWKHFNEMENIPAMIVKSESQEILTKQKCKEEMEDNEEAMNPAFDHITVNQEEVSAISLDDNASLDEDKSVFQEMKATASSEHFREMEIIQAGIETLESQEFSEDGRRMECHHCGEKRETKQEIIQHIVDVHKSIFNEDNRPIRQQKRDKKHTCSVCERRCTSKSLLAVHMRMHTGEKPFQCSICNYRSSGSWHLQRHMRMHTGEKPFQCSICNYRCAGNWHLQRHIRMHTGEKPFSCNICNYTCSRSGYLQRHMLKHTGEKPFQCDICNYRCAGSWHLQRHMRMHTGEKPFQCNVCNYRCARSGHLQRHIQMHTGEKHFQCNICNYMCARSGHLQRHMRMHTGEKLFQCNTCNYSCSESGCLNVHLQKHT